MPRRAEFTSASVAELPAPLRLSQLDRNVPVDGRAKTASRGPAAVPPSPSPPAGALGSAGAFGLYRSQTFSGNAMMSLQIAVLV